MVVFEGVVVEVKELDKLSKDNYEVQRRRGDCYLEWPFEKGVSEQSVHIPVDLLTVQLAEDLIAGQLLLVQQVEHPGTQWHLSSMVLLLVFDRMEVAEGLGEDGVIDNPGVVVLELLQSADRVQLHHKNSAFKHLKSVWLLLVDILDQKLIQTLTFPQ
jgi:hypothetical protein